MNLFEHIEKFGTANGYTRPSGGFLSQEFSPKKLCAICRKPLDKEYRTTCSSDCAKKYAVLADRIQGKKYRDKVRELPRLSGFQRQKYFEEKYRPIKSN